MTSPAKQRAALPDDAICLAEELVYFWPGGRPKHEGYIYFMQTKSLYYENFCADFGPLNLAMTVRFMKRFEALLKVWQRAKVRVACHLQNGSLCLTPCVYACCFFCCFSCFPSPNNTCLSFSPFSLLFLSPPPFFLPSPPPSPFSSPLLRPFDWRETQKSRATGDPLVFLAPSDLEERSNAAALVCVSLVILAGMTPDRVCKPLERIRPPLLPFRDASYTVSTFDLHVSDVVAGVYQGLLNGFADLSSFSPEEYEFYERIENGDFNWMVERKFISMAGPHNVRHVDNGYPHFAPEDFLPYFRENNVTDVVRLNAPLYDRKKFTAGGVKHHDMCFTDGSTPPPRILRQFLTACEAADGAIAVHCKAGLGRTGTLMACYLMKHYRLTGREAIAWLRVARPGSVIGPQQHYVVHKQEEMWAAGEALGATRKTEAHAPQWLRDMAVVAVPAASSVLTCSSSLPSPSATTAAAAAAASAKSARTLSESSSGYGTTCSRSTSVGSMDTADEEGEGHTPQRQQQHEQQQQQQQQQQQLRRSARLKARNDGLSSTASSSSQSRSTDTPTHHASATTAARKALDYTSPPPQSSSSSSSSSATKPATATTTTGSCSSAGQQSVADLQTRLEAQVADTLVHKHPKQEGAALDDSIDGDGSVFADEAAVMGVEETEDPGVMTQGDELTMRKAQAQAKRQQQQQQEAHLHRRDNSTAVKDTPTQGGTICSPVSSLQSPAVRKGEHGGPATVAPPPSSLCTPKRKTSSPRRMQSDIQPRRLITTSTRDGL